MIGRIWQDTFYLDPRTLLPGEDQEVQRAVNTAIQDLQAAGEIP